MKLVLEREGLECRESEEVDGRRDTAAALAGCASDGEDCPVNWLRKRRRSLCMAASEGRQEPMVL